MAEIRFGIERHPEAEFRQLLTDWIETWLRPWFDRRILPVDEEVILVCRRMVAAGKAKGITFSQPDLFIAATAAVHDLCVAPRHSDDFTGAGVPLINPWAYKPA